MTVSLYPTWVIGSVDLTAYPFSVDRDDTVDVGEPDMVVETSEGDQSDGDLERIVHYGNRTYSLTLYIEGPTLVDLAVSEALLRAELRRDLLELEHNPGDNFSPTSVYEVQTAALTPQRRDSHEGHLVRKFTLTLRCSPWARSLDPVTLAPSLTGAPGATPRQAQRSFEVGGTERTPGSIHIQSANGTDPLGLVIVETAPEDGSGRSPSLRRYRTAASTGPVTADASTYSGSREPIAFLAGGFYAEVPTSELPEGGYTLVARMRSLAAEAPTIYWSTSTIFPGDTDQQGYTNGQLLYDFPDTDWQLIPLASLSLPSVRTVAGKVQIVLQAIGSVSQIELEEAWLFREGEDCALSIVDTDQPHLWLDSPDASNPVPTVWVGEELSTRVHPGTGLKAMGSHTLSADGTAVFTAALTNNPSTDVTFYRRWHTNAAS